MGPSRQVEQVMRQIEAVADSPLTILLQGESGTGKELIARTIHRMSARRGGPFVALDCGTIPESLLESEFFGHEKGAFTGADQRREGHFQQAEGGTLFVDEILNLPLSAQPKLLRALQEREVQPLGGRRPASVDARIVTASNASLEHEVQAGRFRQDLYYRLDECKITLPPLRARQEDILYLANRFLAEASAEFRRPIDRFSDETVELLLRYDWPGNVRQLRNAVRRAALLAQDVIRPEHLPALSLGTSAVPPLSNSNGLARGRSLKSIATSAAAEAEQLAICRALHAARGNKSAVARLLEVDRKTLDSRMRRYGIRAAEFRTT